MKLYAHSIQETIEFVIDLGSFGIGQSRISNREEFADIIKGNLTEFDIGFRIALDLSSTIMIDTNCKINSAVFSTQFIGTIL